MKRLLAATLAALALAAPAGADVFRIVPTAPATSPAFLPSAQAPNVPGSVLLTPDLLVPPLVPQTRSYDQLLAIWQRDGALYGVPWQVLAAINKVESNFGRNMGPSSAGAIGWMQFMPSTWERWGVDANGDGVADPWSPEDAIAAAARYLAASGGATDISRAVFSYNHAQWYVDEVMQLAQLFGNGGVDVTFSLDRMQVSLDQAREKVVRANAKLLGAERALRALSSGENALRRHEAASQLLSDQLALDRQATQLGVRRAAAAARVSDLRAAVEQAQQDLSLAKDRSLASSFAPAAGSLLAAPAYDGQYVFPVGGGPSVVSVSHHHHDYPAADIAAPEGTPVYALADATVARSWSYPDPRCGIGLTIDTADGQEWTYCHLSYLDPTVTAGAQLAAGTEVGLVGMTGDATGPHLHLQLDPQTSYPQLQPWFQRFAGIAFRWQDAGPTDVAAQTATHPVFAVVPQQPQEASSPVVLFSR
ncbi:MAG TPA: lytic murein transglycosylase [Gaiellaceae bacterium]|nr:lytic murein transglycosylase [Gaiellaceae bacterium]